MKTSDDILIEETFIKNEEESYKMNFADGDDRGNGPDNQGDNYPRRNNNRSYITIITMLVILGFLIFFIVYFFVIRNQKQNVETYTSADISYNIDADKNGEVDTDESGNPVVLTKWTYRNPDGEYQFRVGEKGIIYEKNIGKLVPYLVNADLYSPKMTIVASHTSSDVYYVSGSFVVEERKEDSTYSKTTHNFSLTIDKYTKDTYLQPILEYTMVKNNSTNTFEKHYGDQKGNYVLVLQSQNTTASWLVPLIFFIIIGVVIFFFISRMLKQSGMGGNPMEGFVNKVGKRQTGSKIRFSDVAGCDEAKAELVELVDYFHSTDKYVKLGAKLPHGVLLVGPPGTGKTLLAKAVAGEANVPFFSASGSDFVEMYVGVGASRIRSLFKTAKSNAPCLVFIDEIDAVGRQRGTGIGGGNDEREQTLNELLVEMDGFDDNSGVIVIAATNRDDVLDAALTRPGRFDRTVTVDLPDRKGRAAILAVHAKNKKLAQEVSFDAIAKRTVGFSGADLANIMNEAAILAVRGNRDSITMADIDEAIDREIAGPAKKSHLEDNEKKQVAYHESGHAVIGLFLPYSDVVQKITIIPRGRTGGHVLMTPEKDRFLMTKNQLLARITGYLGGRTSEEIFFGDVSTGACNDIEVATSIARGMVTRYGMSDLGPIQYEKPDGSVFLGRDYTSSSANYSTQIAYEIDKAVREIVEECHKKAHELLTEHKEDVELIANTLIERETITAEEIEYLIKNRVMPEIQDHVEIKNRPLNKNNIVLYSGYEEFYTAIDKIIVNNPSRIAIAVSHGGRPIDNETFKNRCIYQAKDPSKIGMLFIDSYQASKITLSVESFASHLEDYAQCEVILFITDDQSVRQLRDTFATKKTVEASAVEEEKKNVEDDSVSEKEIEKKEEISSDEKTENKEE